MKKKIYKVLAVLLTMVCCVSSGTSYWAYTKGEPVKVGIFEMEGFQHYNEEGEPEGFCIDYLEVIAGINNWEYEYVPVKDFMDGCKKLDNQEIDLLAPVMMTDARKEKYQYSDMSFGTEYTVLVTNPDREDLYYEDHENFNGIKVGVASGYPMTNYYITYMKNHGFETELLYYDTTDMVFEALEKGEVDAAAVSIFEMKDGQKLLARFSPQPFYFLTYQGNYELLGKLNDTMKRVEETYPQLLNELLFQYYPAYNSYFYTRDEIEYVEQGRKLRVAYIADRKPLSFTSEAGEFAGISRDIIDRIAELSGLQFEYVELPTGEITYDYLQEQKIDLITGVEYNARNMGSDGIFMSRPYISARKVMVSRAEFHYSPNKDYKLAVVEGSKTLNEVLTQNYPNLKIVYYKTIDDCFQALYMKEVDMLIQNQYVVEGLLSKPLYSSFHVVPIDGLNDELCFSTIVPLHGGYGLDEEESSIVISILNKAISQISNTEMDNIVVRGALENQYDVDIFDFLYSYRFTIVVMNIVLIVACICGIRVSMNKKKREIEKAEEERRKDLQQKRYKAIVESSDDLIYEISLDGEGNIGSDKIRKKFGWEIPQEVDNLDFSKAMELLHIHPDDEHVFRQTMLSDGVGKFDEQTLRIQKANGDYLWCRVSRTLLMDENNNVVSILGKIVDIDQEVKEKTSLVRRSRTDLLTGLLNKQTFEKEVRDYVEKHSTENACFVFLDMDHFKEINDIFGHSVGDQVIKETAKKVQLLFANFDLVGRFGGDEFCIFVKDIPRETLIDRLKFAVKKMEQEYPYEGGSVKISASIGAAYCKRNKVSYKELMDVADAAAYKAKDNGRNCYIIQDVE